jgi:hypothetical protein
LKSTSGPGAWILFRGWNEEIRFTPSIRGGYRGDINIPVQGRIVSNTHHCPWDRFVPPGKWPGRGLA